MKLWVIIISSFVAGVMTGSYLYFNSYAPQFDQGNDPISLGEDNTVLTDEESYVSILEAAGFDVIRLPRPDRDYETYVNSLIVNGIVYVPIFDESNDEKALQVYRDLGFKNTNVICDDY